MNIETQGALKIYTDLIQGSDEWKIEKLGLPSTSNFKEFISPTGRYREGRASKDCKDCVIGCEKHKTNRPGCDDCQSTPCNQHKDSGMVKSYIAQLISEDVTTFNPEAERASTYYENRGIALEAEARAEFELTHGVACQQVGLITCDGVAFSPDALVGDEGILEIKCLAGKTLIRYLMDGTKAIPDDHVQQSHGQLAVSGRKWHILKVYHPEITGFEVRTERGKFTDLVSQHVERFKLEMAAARERIKDHLPMLEPIANPAPEPEPPTPTAATDDSTGAGAASDDPYDW